MNKYSLILSIIIKQGMFCYYNVFDISRKKFTELHTKRNNEPALRQIQCSWYTKIVEFHLPSGFWSDYSGPVRRDSLFWTRKHFLHFKMTMVDIPVARLSLYNPWKQVCLKRKIRKPKKTLLETFKMWRLTHTTAKFWHFTRNFQETKV